MVKLKDDCSCSAAVGAVLVKRQAFRSLFWWMSGLRTNFNHTRSSISSSSTWCPPLQLYLEKNQRLRDEPGRLERGMPQISHHWHKTVLLLLLTVRERWSNHQHTVYSRAHTYTHSQWAVSLYILVQTQKVIYEVHHFCFAEFWGEFGLSIHWEHDQREAMLIKSTCTDRIMIITQSCHMHRTLWN